MSFLAGAVGGAAIGGGLAIVVLAPLNAANNYIGSYYFGYGMIGGERDMYQEDWPKIKARLDKGELFATIWEEYVTKNTSGVMKNAGNIVIQVKEEWFNIVRDYFGSIPKDIIDYVLGSSPTNTEVLQSVKEALDVFPKKQTVESREDISDLGPSFNVHTVPSYLMAMPIGKLRTRYLRETNPKSKLLLFKIIQLKLQADPKILKPDIKKTSNKC